MQLVGDYVEPLLTIDILPVIQDDGAFLFGGLQGGVDETLSNAANCGIQRSFDGLVVCQAVDEVLDGIFEGVGEVIGWEILAFGAIFGLYADD